MSGAHKNHPINTDGSRICIHCKSLLPASSFRQYSISVCVPCLNERTRKSWLKLQTERGRNPFEFQNLLEQGKKVCPRCTQVKDLKDFGRSYKAKIGIRSSCLECDAKQNKEYEQKNREKINFNRRQRRKDPERNIIICLRDRHRAMFKFNSTYKAKGQTHIIREWLGCSVADCRKHIESLFQPGMTWDNRGMGQGKWQIDHKIPIIMITLKDNEVQDTELNRKILHFTNLQPLWHTDNAKKSARYEGSNIRRKSKQTTPLYTISGSRNAV